MRVGPDRPLAPPWPPSRVRALTRSTLVDAGPLVAFLNRRDRHHRWATGRLAELPVPLLTCEAVVSETCFLLRHARGGPSAVPQPLDRVALRIALRPGDNAGAVGSLMARYARVPTSSPGAGLDRV